MIFLSKWSFGEHNSQPHRDTLKEKRRKKISEVRELQECFPEVHGKPQDRGRETKNSCLLHYFCLELDTTWEIKLPVFKLFRRGTLANTCLHVPFLAF